MNKHFLLLFFFLAVLIAAPTSATAQSAAQVYLAPVASNNNSVTVELIANNVTDLYGVEFLLNFNPAEVSVQDSNPQQDGIQVEAGQLLPESQGFVVVNRADAATGKIAFAMTLLNPAPAVTGSGSLARITFNLEQTGASQVEIEDVKLVSFALQTIPVETTGLTIGEAATGESFPWWIAALIIITAGLAILGGLIFFANNNAQKAHSHS